MNCHGVLLVCLVLSSCVTGRPVDSGSDPLERPKFLVAQMLSGELKSALTKCSTAPLAHVITPTSFSIGHRGAAREFAEHTRESYQAAAEQGAGIIECDVTFTSDRQLVCRHSQCDLHRTTNILTTPLAAKCSLPFQGAVSSRQQKATARCCTSDITLAEFKSLCGRIDYVNEQAESVANYLDAQPPWLKKGQLLTSCPQVLSHRESIVAIDQLGANFSPELKAPQVSMPFQKRFSQHDFAAKMFAEYEELNIDPSRVWPQSFQLTDIESWLQSYPEYSSQTVFLDNRKSKEPTFTASTANMQALYDQGVRIVAPSIFSLVELDPTRGLVASSYAQLATQAGLKIITWTFDSGRIPKQANGKPFFSDADRYQILDVLAQDVGVIGVFSDWPISVSYYANCML